MPPASKALHSPILVRPFWDGRYTLVAPQGRVPGRVYPSTPRPLPQRKLRSTGPSCSAALGGSHHAPLGDRCASEGSAGWEPHLVEVLHGEKEHGPLPLGRQGTGRRQQDAEGQSSEESFPTLRTQGSAQPRHWSLQKSGFSRIFGDDLR